MRVLDNVRQVTIQPIIEKFIKPRTLVNTDEYDIYGRLTAMGLRTQNVVGRNDPYGMPRSRRGCPRRGRRRASRNFGTPTKQHARQHDGGCMVATAKLVASPPWNFAGTFTCLRRIFPVCTQRPPTRKLAPTKPRRSSRRRQPGLGVETSEIRNKNCVALSPFP